MPYIDLGLPTGLWTHSERNYFKWFLRETRCLRPRQIIKTVKPKRWPRKAGQPFLRWRQQGGIMLYTCDACEQTTCHGTDLDGIPFRCTSCGTSFLEHPAVEPVIPKQLRDEDLDTDDVFADEGPTGRFWD